MISKGVLLLVLGFFCIVSPGLCFFSVSDMVKDLGSAVSNLRDSFEENVVPHVPGGELAYGLAKDTLNQNLGHISGGQFIASAAGTFSGESASSYSQMSTVGFSATQLESFHEVYFKNNREDSFIAESGSYTYYPNSGTCSRPPLATSTVTLPAQQVSIFRVDASCGSAESYQMVFKSLSNKDKITITFYFSGSTNIWLSDVKVKLTTPYDGQTITAEVQGQGHQTAQAGNVKHYVSVISFNKQNIHNFDIGVAKTGLDTNSYFVSFENLSKLTWVLKESANHQVFSNLKTTIKPLSQFDFTVNLQANSTANDHTVKYISDSNDFELYFVMDYTNGEMELVKSVLTSLSSPALFNPLSVGATPNGGNYGSREQGDYQISAFLGDKYSISLIMK